MLVRLDLRQIRYFLALYEEHSITRAAERLNVVQPAVSMQIRRLEGDYGVELFERTSSGVFPNKIADDLYRTFTKILADAEAAHHYLLSASGKITGELAVGLPPSLALGPAYDFVRRYNAAYPDVKLRVVEGYSSNLVEWLESDELDIAILSTEVRIERLSEVLLMEEPMVVVAPRDLLPSEQDEIDAATVGALNLILPSRGNLLRVLIDEYFESCGTTLSPRMEVDSLGTVVRLVRSGEGATILPKFCAKEIAKDSDLVVVGLTPSLNRMLVAAHTSKRSLSPAAEAFVEVLAETLSQQNAS